MPNKITKKQVLAFLKRHQNAAIATVTPQGKPEVANIYYGIDNRFHLYFPTGTLSRKFKNLSKNPHVALSVTDPKKLITVQMEGVARITYSTAKDAHIVQTLAKVLTPTLREVLDRLWDPVPPVIKMKNGKLAILEVQIKWVRFADFSLPPKTVNGQYYQIVKL